MKCVSVMLTFQIMSLFYRLKIELAVIIIAYSGVGLHLILAVIVIWMIIRKVIV